MTGQLKIMGKHGHTSVVWDIVKEAEVIAARAAFDAEMATKGTAAFATRPGTAEPAERIREFDPQAESIVIIKPMAGG